MTARLIDLLYRARFDRRGVSSMEYGILAAAVVAAVITAVGALSGYIDGAMDRIGTALGG
jgi:Flp pilus assembly pilin Flp